MQKLVPASPTGGVRSVSIVHLHTQATEVFINILSKHFHMKERRKSTEPQYDIFKCCVQVVIFSYIIGYPCSTMYTLSRKELI
jgi:hypothetical protein